MRKIKILALILVLGIFLGTQLASGQTYVPGNPTCCELGYGDFGFKIDAQVIGTDLVFTLTSGTQNGYPTVFTDCGEPLSDANNSITITSDGVTFSWTSTLGIDAIIVKAGPGANVYVYDPEATSGSGLITPDGKDISHIEFCYDYEVDVEKDAETSFTRTYNWTITKEVTPGTWDLFQGDEGTSQYTVTVDKTGFTDSYWAVSGTITISNNTPFTAEITGVSDEISDDIPVTPNCGISFPYTLPSGQSVTCTYSSPLPDGSDRINTATVTTQKTEDNPVGGAEGKADVTFGEPTTLVNDEINVTDTNGEAWGPVSDDASWTYERTFTCEDEGTNDNTATITETGDSDDASVTVNCHALNVTKDANTSFDRNWTWTIDKSADQTDLTLSPRQQFVVNYEVSVDASYTDNNHAVNGSITITNPAPIAATINSISDVVSTDIAANVDCGDATFPHTLEAGGTLLCTYSASLSNADPRTNTATATLQNYSYASDGTATATGTTDFSGSADVVFSSTPTNEYDECVDVKDDLIGSLGTVCSGDAPAIFTYSYTVGPYADPEDCGDNYVTNIASFITNDNSNTAEASWTVHIYVPCAEGCTLTPGYWKTHSSYGPAPYDDTWAGIGEDTPFFLSGQSYYEVLWTPPKGGNAYYILAHQYIAAELNFLNGADPSAAQDAFDKATDLFNEYTPDDVAKLKGKAKNTWTGLPETLDQYNNGLIGPGHCDEDDNTGVSSSTINKTSGQSSNKSQEKDTEKTVNAQAEASKDEKSKEVQEQTTDLNEKQTVELNKASDQPTDIVQEIPTDYSLMQNHPNPFNPSTTISFNLPKATKATLTIFNVSGQKVATLVSDYLNAGSYSFQWNISNNLPAGIYFYRLETAEFTSTKQMIYLK